MKQKWIKGLAPVVVLVVGVLGMKAISASNTHEEEKKPVDTRPTVKVQQVEAEDYQVTIIGHGEVKPKEVTTLSAQVSGEVVKWHPNFVAGGLVKRGEVLFEIEPEAYEAALMQAQASLKSAEAQLIEEQGRAEVAKQEAKTLPKARVTDLYLRKPQLLSAEAMVKSAKANVKIAQRDLDNCVVTAPFDALIVSRDLGAGQFVNRGTPVSILYNVESAEVVFPIAGFDSTFLPEQLMGLTANVSSDGRYSFSRPGIIVRDLGVVDSATRMSNLVVQIDDPYSLNNRLPKVKFGQYVSVSFDGQVLNKVFRLSQDLVADNSVWVVDNNNLLVHKDVDVIREDGSFFVIGGGLTETDRIVTTLPEYPKVGMEVKIAGLNDVAASTNADDQQDIAVSASNN
jgi:RND family efflux transporter MFP subunit